MADRIENFTTRIFLNSEQAKNKIVELKKEIDKFRQKKEEAAEAGDWKTFNKEKKKLDEANRQMQSLQTSAQKVSNILRNLDSSSPMQINE